ncbi:Protein kinase domain-containing protein [Mycena sanguinolenta]|uniref:Protein kinase domain-containing protein n=1 Tax=Mycena sanguinolenta TaxID=230812 RepID=A0A8H6YHJ3_9AGAR|nr:Protein kinase domain-containing protein [Mycena sanguinolenta]
MSDPPILPPTASWIIRPDEFENTTHLGGPIAQGRWRNSVVILKVLSKQAEPSALHQRGELWTSLRHPNVLQMFGVSPLDADPLYVVIHFQPDGNVMRFLERNPSVDRAKIVYDVVLGMQYLHARGVVHGSLKPTNILVGDGRACISDYGMIEVQTSGSHGHRYFSPEAWKGLKDLKTVSRSSDVFAWAMCALEIFTSKAPWGILTEKQIFRLVVRQDSRPDRPDEDFGLTDHIWGVMEECWHRESRLRPTFDILVQLLRDNNRIQMGSIPRVEVVPETPDGQLLAPPIRALSPGDSLASLHSQRSRHPPSMISGPPAYEIMSTGLHPESAPPATLEFTQSTSSKRPFTPVRLQYTPDRSETPSKPSSAPFVATSQRTGTPIDIPPSPPRQYSHEGSDGPTVPHPGSAPPAVLQYPVSVVTPPRRNSSDLLPPRRQYTHDGSDASTASSPDDSFDEGGLSPMFNNSLSLQSPETPNTPWSVDRRLAPSPSVRTSSSGGSSRSQHSASRAAASKRLRSIGPIGEEDPGATSPRSLPSNPSPTPHDHSKWSNAEPGYLKHMPSTSTFPTASISTYPTEYSSRVTTSANTYAESIRSQQGRTAPNANLLAGALLTEVKEGRKPEIIDGYLDKIQRLALKSHKDAQKLVTAGVIPTLILLVKTRAVDGVGLETVLLTLGILAHDPITANTIYRTGTSATLIEIIDAALSDDMAALAVWCLARICRSTEIAIELIKLNLGRLLVTKGLKGGQRTSRMSAWCLGILIRSDNIADSLAEMGLANALCEHLRRCSESINAGPEDYSATVYAVARLSRSIKISKALAKGGCVGMLSHFLITAEDPRVLLWTSRAIGCLMRPNSSDMAKVLLDAGVARGLARLPSMLPTEEVEPLGFLCLRYPALLALVDAGVVDALLAAFRTAADEPYPQVHIELAYAIALLSDVGGTPIRKQIVNAGGIDILKQIAGSTGRPDVAKACNLAATSINGNLWSRNTASAKAAMAHEWSGGCPDYLPECPVPLNDLQSESKDDW